MGHRNLNARSLARGTIEGHAAANALRSFPHAAQAKPSIGHGLTIVYLKANPIIFNIDKDIFRYGLTAQVNGVCLRMAANVFKPFFNNAVELVSGLERQRWQI